MPCSGDEEPCDLRQQLRPPEPIGAGKRLFGESPTALAAAEPRDETTRVGVLLERTPPDEGGPAAFSMVGGAVGERAERRPKTVGAAAFNRAAGLNFHARS